MNRKLKYIVWIVFLGALALVLLWVVFLRQSNPSRDQYSAVFLDNDQVYFGRLQVKDKGFWALVDVYYLRAGRVQASGSEEEPQVQGTPQIDLVKLGSELHAPKDEMLINPEHVIFYEALGEQGQIMQLIRNFEAK